MNIYEKICFIYYIYHIAVVVVKTIRTVVTVLATGKLISNDIVPTAIKIKNMVNK